jgi:hypothetical protein
MDRLRLKNTCFLVGLQGVLLYIVCLVIPFELYFRDRPVILPQEPPGYLKYEPVNSIAYFLSHAESGCLWLILCALSIFHGEPSATNPRLRIILRSSGVLLLVWAASYIRSFPGNINSVLD